MSRLDRREFLRHAAGGLVAGAMAGCELPRHVPSVRRVRGGPLPGTEDFVKSVCLQCPAGCGIRVRRVDGIPVRIDGNPDYPTNRGGLCPKGVAGLQVLFDPDRVKGPVRRVGTRGAGVWKPISWDEALDLVAARLRVLRAAPGPHTVAFLGGRYQGSMEPLVQSFLRAYGSPNDLGNGSVGSDGTKIALEMTQGIRDYPGFDWEDTDYVISFGASWLEAYRPTAHLLRAFAYLRRGRPGRRAKLVHVDTRFSVTSAKADEWVPIRPGTDAALALGMAHVLIRDELYDAEYVRAHTFGFDAWEDGDGRHAGWKDHVLERYAPDRVAGITGVEAERVVRLAREFAERQPGFAVGERGTSMQSNGLYTRMAIHALNALVGSLNRKGGVLVQQPPPLSPMPEPQLDAVARAGLRRPRLDKAGTRARPLAREASQALPDAVLSGKPYVPEALFVYYTNPLFSRTNADEFRRALERIPFLVSFSPFLDETSARCDLILPDHTYLERWQEVEILPSVGFPVLGIRQPVVEPLYDTRHTGDVLLQLAARLGGDVAASLPFKSYRKLMEKRLEGLPLKGSGKSRLKRLSRKGGWWAPGSHLVDDREFFRTPSGRFEFYSQTLRARLDAVLREGEARDGLLAELGVAARGDEAFWPHYEPSRFAGEEDEFPLHLNTYKPMNRAEGRGANQPWLQEISATHVHSPWRSWLEIHPETARHLGIGDGDEVWLESPKGRLRIRALHYAGARPDVVNLPFDRGHGAGGRWAVGRGANPNEIIVRDEDRLAGVTAYFGTRVRVRRV